jgi:hypothetical protein
VPSGCDGLEVFIEDLLVGDAGIGNTFHINYNLYSQYIPDTAGAKFQKPTKELMLSQAMSNDNRPRYWEVTFFGTDLIIRNADKTLTAQEQLELFNITQTNLGAWIRENGCPTVNQGIAKIGDPSGGRNQTFDVIGKRSFDLISQSVQAGFLTQENSYRVDGSVPVAQQVEYDGLVAFTNLAVRIAPLAAMDTAQTRDQVSECIELPPGETTTICYPPSTVAVEVFWPTDGTAADLSADIRLIHQLAITPVEIFDVTIAALTVPAAGGLSGRIPALNGSGLGIANAGLVDSSVCVVFTLEP